MYFQQLQETKLIYVVGEKSQVIYKQEGKCFFGERDKWLVVSNDPQGLVVFSLILSPNVIAK
jgi:hypothetical protein